MSTPGSFDWTPQGPAISSLSIPISSYLYDPSKSGDDRFQFRPNVFVEQVESKSGAVPTAARMSYLLDARAGALGWPNSFETLFPLNTPPSPYAFANDDQIVVIASMPDDTTKVLFHGYAQAPQLDLDPQGQHVTFVAYGAAIRCWDNVIDFRRQRNNDALTLDPEFEGEVSGKGTYCDLLKPVHFNPLRVGNMIPAESPMETLDNGRDEYPIFTDDPLWKYYKDANTKQPKLWTLSGFVTYILAVYNDEKDVVSPSFQGLVELLDSRVPKHDLYDPSDPDTYDANPIIIPDYDVSGMRWPEALAKMLEMHGFEMQFLTSLEEEFDSGEPKVVNRLKIYRRDQAGPQDPKQVYLPPLGTGVDQQYANVGSVHLAWDLAAVRNAVSVEMAREELEISFILAPNFEPVAGDDMAGDGQPRKTFDLDQLSQATDAVRKKYRQFVAGDGNGQYWSYSKKKFVTGDPITDKPVRFKAYYKPDPNKPPAYEAPEYAIMFMPTLKTLITRDDKNQVRKSILEVWVPTTTGTDPGRNPEVMGTFGVDPGLDNGSWINVPNGWELLEDRIGVNITVQDPESFSIDKSHKRIHFISGSDPTDDIGKPQRPTFMLRLTTVIQMPERVPVNQGMRTASPTKFPRWMLVDRQDQYKIQSVDTKDYDMLATSDKQTYPRDDYPDARDEAASIRDRHEFPPLAGSITIPSLSLSYQVSDRISKIVGRDISLQCNAGTGQEKPTYPWVVSVTWNFTGPSQTTTLQLSDRRLDTIHQKMPVKTAAQAMGGFLGALAAGGQITGKGQAATSVMTKKESEAAGPQRGQPSGKFTPTPGRGMPADAGMPAQSGMSEDERRRRSAPGAGGD